MSGWGSFTHLWCEYGFTLQQDPCCSGMLLWILTVFASNKFFFFLCFCIQHILFFFLPLALFPPPFSVPGPFFLIDSARSSGQSVALALERAWDQFLQNFKCSLGCQCGIICLQGYTTNHNIFCFVIGVLSVRRHCKLEAQGKTCQMHYAFADVGENIWKPHVCMSNYCLQILCFEIRCEDN